MGANKTAAKKRTDPTIVEIRVDSKTGKWTLHGPGGELVESGEWTKLDGAKRAIRVPLAYDASEYMHALVEHRGERYRAHKFKTALEQLAKGGDAKAKAIVTEALAPWAGKGGSEP